MIYIASTLYRHVACSINTDRCVACGIDVQSCSSNELRWQLSIATLPLPPTNTFFDGGNLFQDTIIWAFSLYIFVMHFFSFVLLFIAFDIIRFFYFIFSFFLSNTNISIHILSDSGLQL